MIRQCTILVLLAVAALGFSFVHPFGDPRSEPPQGLGMLLRESNIPASAKEVLRTKCADCHSAETHWPAYARVAPASWLIERDIIEARKRMDLSQWEQMSPDKRDLSIAKIIGMAKTGRMPPIQYRALHWKAKLTTMDIAALAAMSTIGGNEVSPNRVGDPAHGKLLFERRCAGCHALTANREGPRLAGVFGRKAGSAPGFRYSSALSKFDTAWDEAKLEKWLTDPELLVPKNNMDFSLLKADERRDIIAYLKQTK